MALISRNCLFLTFYLDNQPFKTSSAMFPINFLKIWLSLLKLPEIVTKHCSDSKKKTHMYQWHRGAWLTGVSMFLKIPRKSAVKYLQNLEPWIHEALGSLTNRKLIIKKKQGRKNFELSIIFYSAVSMTDAHVNISIQNRN